MRNRRGNWKAKSWKLEISDWKIQFRSCQRALHNKTLPPLPEP